MDTVYPEPIRLKLGTANRKKRGSQSRYRTQPVTFSEIKEVDEENTEEETAEVNRRMSLSVESGAPVTNSKSSTNVNASFEELFARRRERLLNRKSQSRLDIPRKPAINSIPSPPQNGSENADTSSAVSTQANILNEIDNKIT